MRGVTLAQGNPRKKPTPRPGYQSSHLNGGGRGSATIRDQRGEPRVSAGTRPNVFVAGSALFPQNSCYNPTGTIGALAYWTAMQSSATTCARQEN